MAVQELGMPREPYADGAVKFLTANAKTFEDIRIAAAGLEAIQAKSSKSQAWLNDIAHMQNSDGTFGKGAGQARATASAVVTVLRLGGMPKDVPLTLKVLKEGQRFNGGFGKADHELASDLESTYRVMRCFKMLGARARSGRGLAHLYREVPQRGRRLRRRTRPTFFFVGHLLRGRYSPLANRRQIATLPAMWRGIRKDDSCPMRSSLLKDEANVPHHWEHFATTPWTTVLAAGSGISPDAQEALPSLCQAYWYPLYAYVRRLGHQPNDAQDLTQGFFARILEKNYLRAADPRRGRFRSFLLTAFNRFLSKERDRAQAQRRGGGRRVLPLDFEAGENRYSLEPAHGLTAERIFEQRWAMTLLDQVVARLRGIQRGW